MFLELGLIIFNKVSDSLWKCNTAPETVGSWSIAATSVFEIHKLPFLFFSFCPGPLPKHHGSGELHVASFVTTLSRFPNLTSRRHLQLPQFGFSMDFFWSRLGSHLPASFAAATCSLSL